jgi:hypothetical protein
MIRETLDIVSSFTESYILMYELQFCQNVEILFEGSVRTKIK